MARSTLLFLPLALVGGLLLADDDKVTVFRSDVSLVRVDVQVLDRDRHPLTGLRVEDFQLTDNGRSRDIKNFASEEMPLDVLLLLDVSGSMRPHVERIASASEQALQALGKDDRVAIMVFDRATRVRLPFRANRQEVVKEFSTLLKHEGFRGGTDITAALISAADYVQRNARREARRAIVILTDDQTEFDRDVEGVERVLTRADAVLSALLAPDAMGNRTYFPGGGYPRGGSYPRRGGYPGGGGGYPGGGFPWPGGRLPMPGPVPGGGGGGYPAPGPGGGGHRTHSAGTAEIAEASGGDSMPVDDAAALQTTLERLRQRYALHFLAPPGTTAGRERSIEVALAGAARRRYPDAELRFRRTYVPNVSVPGDAGPVNSDPTVVTQVPSSRDEGPGTPPDPPRLRRRVVTDDSGGARGPNPSVGAPAAAPAATPPPKADPPPPSTKAGWRRVDEPEPASKPVKQ